VRHACFALVVVVVAACGDSKAPAPAATPASIAAAQPAAAPGSPDCPATGLWAACSLRYRLDRGGLAVSIDSGAKPDEKELTGTPLLLKVGRASRLALYIYPDSTARIADAKKLDRSQLISDAQVPTIKRERTLIESVNVIGLLTSIDNHLRERVADNILAGPPQPASGQPLPAQPVKAKSR
jgi:hypothetical protein